HRIAAGEQGHVVAEPHQLLRQVGDDALGAAIEPGRNALHQGGDLRNSHVMSLPPAPLRCPQRTPVPYNGSRARLARAERAARAKKFPPRAQSWEKASVERREISARRESRRVCCTTIGKSDSNTDE